jgi:hypothetical protein
LLPWFFVSDGVGFVADAKTCCLGRSPRARSVPRWFGWLVR